MSKSRRDGSALQWAAFLVPMMSALPAAYFVGRSTYYYLVLGWFETHVRFWPALGILIAVIAGLVVEGLGTVSLFLWSSFQRWNRAKAIRDDGTLKRGYDLAPEGLALVALGGYVAAVVVLLVLLEWQPGAARFAPVMFPVLTVVGGLCWSLYDQHRDRLAYHGIAWNWVTLEQDASETKKEQGKTKPELDGTDRAIVRLFAEQPDPSFQSVADALGMAKSTVHRRATALEREGVRVRGKGNNHR